MHIESQFLPKVESLYISFISVPYQYDKNSNENIQFTLNMT